MLSEDDDLSCEELKQLAIDLCISPNTQELEAACLNEAYQKCQKDDWKTIERLARVLSRLKDKQENTLLTVAIRCADSTITQKLLKLQIGLKEKDSQGNTPLHLAASLDAANIIPLLLVRGTDNKPLFDLNARNQKGNTPLHIAIELGHDQTLGLLIEKADLKRQKKEGNTLLHFVVTSEQSQIVDYLIYKHWKAISTLIETPNDQGLTPLSLAAYLGDARSLYILAKGGGNIQAKDSEGNTPLHWACKGSKKEAIDCLISLGAYLFDQNTNGYQPKELINTKSPQGKQLYIYFETLEITPQLAKISLEVPIKNLVFQGGGPKGIAFIPPIQDLERKNILEHVERVAGASAGAIMAALIAVGYSSEDLKNELSKKKDGQPLLSKFLDYPPILASEVQELLEKATQGEMSQKFEQGMGIKEVVLAEISAGWKYFWLSAKKKAALNQIYKNGGICKGDFFLNWMEKKIRKATGIPHCTFGELKQLVKEKTLLSNGKIAKHLYVIATKIGNQHSSQEFSSEDFTCDDLIISHTIRMSMSIPFAYVPHMIHKKVNGKPEPCPEKGYFVDGGVLNNFPIRLFDKKKHQNQYGAQNDPDGVWINPHTLAFSLHDPETIQDDKDPTLMTVAKEIAKIVSEAEMIHIKEQESKRHRIININNQGVGLLEFNLSTEREKNLLDEAEKQSKLFFKDYTLGRLSNLDTFYNYGRFKEKEANGTLFLTPPCPDFSGRKQELQELEKTLINDNHQKTVSIVSLVGQRGYGKSELAMAFAALHLHKFSLVWKLDHRNPEALEKSYKQLAHALKLSHVDTLPFDTLRSTVNTALEKSSKPWLIVFDNVDQGGVPPYPRKGGSVLITTTDECAFQNVNPFHLTSLKVEGETLMETILGKKDPGIPQLAKQLNHVPLLMRQAANYITAEEINAYNYHKLLDKKGITQTSSYPQILKACWEIASEGLKKHNPDARTWLLFSSFLDNKEVPKEWLQAFLASNHSEQHPKLHCMETQRILNFLTSYALISSYKYDETFSIHGYFQEIIRESQPSPKESLNQLLALMLEFQAIKDYNPTHPEAIIGFQKVFPHVVSVLNHSKALEASPDASIPLGLNTVRYFIETKRNLLKAQEYLNLTQTLMSTCQNHPRHGRIEFFQGIIDAKTATKADPVTQERLFKSALAHFKKAYDIYEQQPDLTKYNKLEQNKEKCNQKYQQAICLEEQAQMLTNLNKLQEAADILEIACKHFASLDPLHFDIPRITRDQANILLKQDRSLDAIKKINEAIEMQKEVYKQHFDSHKTVAATYANLAIAYEALKTSEGFKWADDAYKQAISINERAFKTENHDYIARLYGKRADMAKNMGKPGQEKIMREKQQAILKYLNENP
jgi:NTE family protein